MNGVVKTTVFSMKYFKNLYLKLNLNNSIMKQPLIKHQHLKTLIEDIFSNDNKLTEDLLSKLINELRYSNLLIPARSEDNTLNFIIYEIDGLKFTPLFTDLDEFHKFFKGEDLRILDNSFELYQNILKTNDVDGYILNPASENYILDKELVLSIKHMPKTFIQTSDSYSKEELYDMYLNMDNSSLEEFISKRENIGDFEGLFEEFSKSIILTLMISTREFDDDIVDMTKTGPLAFMHIDNVGGKYAIIYSSRDKLNDVNVDYKLFKYAQIVNLSTLVNYILLEDLDGLILNLDSDNVLIPRGVLLKYSRGFELYSNDDKLATAIFYMFKI